MIPTGTIDHIRNYFIKPFPDLTQEVQKKIEHINQLRDELVNFAHRFDVQILLKHRILASNTLRRGEGLLEWENASKYITQQVIDDKLLTTDHLKKINSLLANSEQDWRTVRLYTADEEYLPPEFLAEFKEYFDTKLPLYHNKPLQQAFLAYCWTVSMHGFMNHNGRTARLAGDWILLQNGYIPIYFARSFNSHVAQTINGPIRDILFEFIKYLSALEDSFEIMRIK